MSTGNPYEFEAAAFGSPAALAAESERAAFVRRTYTHLAGAIFAFVGVEAALLTLVPQDVMQRVVGQMTGGLGWLVVLGAFIGVSWIARSWAERGGAPAMQYAGLGLFVLAEAVIFLPLMYLAMRYVGPEAPLMAGMLTGVTFGGLTAFVFVTRVDLSWMGKYLFLASLIAMAAIVGAILIPGISLGGVVFPAIMVALASGYILYDTSNIQHHYRTDQHVAASLALFASVALLFWYILQMVMALSSSD